MDRDGAVAYDVRLADQVRRVGVGVRVGTLQGGVVPDSVPEEFVLGSRRRGRGLSGQQNVRGDAGDGRDYSKYDEGGQEAESERGNGAYAGGPSAGGGGGAGGTALVTGQAGECRGARGSAGGGSRGGSAQWSQGGLVREGAPFLGRVGTQADTRGHACQVGAEWAAHGVGHGLDGVMPCATAAQAC